jgi:hypothetical protein
VSVRTVLVTVVLASGACASLPACPARGGPAWTEWDTPHFQLLTDLDAADAQAVALHFERLRAAVLLAAWRRAPEPHGRITVVALRSWRERQVFIPAGCVATFAAKDALKQALIIEGGDEQDDIVTRTLVLALGHHYGLQGNSRWLDEGLSQYFAPLRIADDETVTYGQVDPAYARAATFGGLTSFARLWQPITLPDRDRFLVTSWLAVHYLFNNEGPRFEDFQRRVIESKDAPGAWRAVFPDLTADVMDARLSGYVFRDGQFATFTARLPSVSAEARARPVDDAGVHALRALLYATADAERGTHEAEVRAEVAEALRLDPLQIVAVYLQHVVLHERQTDLDTAKKIVAREPDSAMAWLILAVTRAARHEPTEAHEAWEEVSARTGPTDQSALEPQVARPY